MSYTPTNWVKGDVITAERLNKIEQGIQSVSSGGSNSFIVNLYNNPTYADWYNLDQTLGSIYAAVMAGKHVVINYWNEDNSLYCCMPVTGINQIDKLNDTSIVKYVNCKEEYWFVEKDPSNYPIINYYNPWGE